MSITRRLAALEAVTHQARGFRTFERIGDPDTHVETTKCAFDHSWDIQAGNVPEFVRRWTSAEIDALGVDGRRCIVITPQPKQPNTRIVSDKHH